MMGINWVKSTFGTKDLIMPTHLDLNKYYRSQLNKLSFLLSYHDKFYLILKIISSYQHIQWSYDELSLSIDVKMLNLPVHRILSSYDVKSMSLYLIRTLLLNLVLKLRNYTVLEFNFDLSLSRYQTCWINIFTTTCSVDYFIVIRLWSKLI